jgi:hypothetical protein
LVQSWLLEYLSVQQEKQLRTGLRGGTKNERERELMTCLSRHQLKMVVAILTGHAPVRRHLYIMGLFDRDPACRLCRMETETVQHTICCCEVLARQRYNVFGKLTVEPKNISTAPCASL